MSDTTTRAIFDKLSKLECDVSFIRGRMEESDRHRISESDITERVKTHIEDYHKNTGGGLGNKAVIAIATGAGGAAAALAELIKYLGRG